MSNSIADAVQFAVNICNDETHGYNKNYGHRELNPDTDCSGLVYFALQAGGFSVPSYVWSTADMMDYLRNMGFTEYIYRPSTYNQYIPVHGDICVHREETERRGHALFYAEEVLGFPTKYDGTRSIIPRARVEAVKDNDGEPGDSQSVRDGAYDEVWVHNWDGLYGSYTWHVFRWGGEPPTPTPTGDIPTWLLFKMKDNKEDERRTFI